MLKRAKNHIEQVITMVENNREWTSVHQQIELAILQLRQATKQIARYHIDVCILGKRKDFKNPLVDEDIVEIIKTYRYLN